MFSNARSAEASSTTSATGGFFSPLGDQLAREAPPLRDVATHESLRPRYGLGRGVDVQPRLIEVHYDLITGLETQPPAILRGYDDSATLTYFCLDLIHVSSNYDLTTDGFYGGLGASGAIALLRLLLRDGGGEIFVRLASVRSPFLACGHDQGVALVGGGIHAHLASAGGIHDCVRGSLAIQGHVLDGGASGEGVADGQLPAGRCGDVGGVAFAAARGGGCHGAAADPQVLYGEAWPGVRNVGDDREATGWHVGADA